MGWMTQVLISLGSNFPLYYVWTGFGAHPASYSMGTGGSFPGVKRLGREADRSPPSSAKVKNGGAIPPLPTCLHGIVLNELIKHRDNFTFFYLIVLDYSSTGVKTQKTKDT
jgi:hypothetical protein